MRAGKLITLSAVAVFVGGTSLATNVAAGETSLHSGSSMHGSSLNKGSGYKHHGIRHGAYAGASARELGEAGTGAGLGTQSPGTQERIARKREMMRSIPRLSNIGTDVRIDAVVPRSVRQAAAPLPAEVQRMHPRLRNDRAFRYRDQVVIVNPTTSRIVAIVKMPT